MGMRAAGESKKGRPIRVAGIEGRKLYMNCKQMYYGRGRRAFTLMETIGVLAVLSILVSVATTNIMYSIQRSKMTLEEESLTMLSEGLVEYVRTERSIPGVDNWVDAVASKVALPLVDVEVNEVGGARQLLVDPNFWDTGSNTLPRTQSAFGWGRPESPRLIILSSVGEALPEDEIPFGPVWEAEPGGVISTNAPWDSWSGQWNDIRFERVNLSSLFHQVTLNNVGGDSSAGYKIDDGGDEFGESLSISDTAMNAFFLDGTVLELAVDDHVMAREIVRHDNSYYFNRGAWRDHLVEGVASRDPFTMYLTEELKSWVELYDHQFVDLWLDTRQDRFDLVANVSDCPGLVFLDVVRGADSGFQFSSIQGAGAAETVGGVVWHTGTGGQSNHVEMGTLSGTFDEETSVLTINDLPSNDMELESGGLFGSIPGSSIVGLSSMGLDFSVEPNALMGTIEYFVDLDPLDAEIDESGSFYIYNYGFGFPANQLVALGDDAYQVTLWGNNYDNVGGGAPDIGDIRGINLRMEFQLLEEINE